MKVCRRIDRRHLIDLIVILQMVTDIHLALYAQTVDNYRFSTLLVSVAFPHLAERRFGVISRSISSTMSYGLSYSSEMDVSSTSNVSHNAFLINL